MNRWHQYFEYHRNSQHHALLRAATTLMKLPRGSHTTEQLTALDLGCGTGRDTIFLLEQGLATTAVDIEAEAIEITRTRCEDNRLPEPVCINRSLETLQLDSQYDLISSNLTLPFIQRDNFYAVWAKIVQHIAINGKFSGQFFGPEHAWSSSPEMTFLSYQQMINLFRVNFYIQLVRETKKEIPTVSKGIQYWHQWDIIAHKRAINPERPITLTRDYDQQILKLASNQIDSDSESNSGVRPQCSSHSRAIKMTK